MPIFTMTIEPFERPLWIVALPFAITAVPIAVPFVVYTATVSPSSEQSTVITPLFEVINADFEETSILFKLIPTEKLLEHYLIYQDSCSSGFSM